MKLFVVGDLHIGDLPYFILSSASRTAKFRALRLETAKHILRLLDKTEADRLLFLGDIFHSGGDTTISVIESKELALYSSLSFATGLEPSTLVGNHDYLEKGDSLLDLFFTRVISELQALDAEKESLMIYYPYPRESCSYPVDEVALIDKFLDGIKEKKGRRVYFFMHSDLSEWYVNLQGIDKGLSWELIEEKITKALKPKSILCVDGHLHSYYREKNLLVLGSPIKSTFKTSVLLVPDEDLKPETGGMCLIDTKKNSVEVFSNPFSPLFVKLDARKHPFGDWALEKLKAFRSDTLLFLDVIVDEGKADNIPREELEKLTDGFRIRHKKDKKSLSREVGSASFEDLSTKELIEFIKTRIKASASSQKVIEAAEEIFSPDEVEAIIEALKEDRACD